MIALVADKDYDDSLVAVFVEEASLHLPFDLKDRLSAPDEITECNHWDRMTFVQTTWDDFGGDHGPGFCIACGHERDADESYWLAADEDIDRRMQEDD